MDIESGKLRFIRVLQPKAKFEGDATLEGIPPGNWQAGGIMEPGGSWDLELSVIDRDHRRNIKLPLLLVDHPQFVLRNAQIVDLMLDVEERKSRLYVKGERVGAFWMGSRQVPILPNSDDWRGLVYVEGNPKYAFFIYPQSERNIFQRFHIKNPFYIANSPPDESGSISF